jgi:hypothetical protein
MTATVTMLAPKKASACKKKKGGNKGEGKNRLLFTERFSVFFGHLYFTQRGDSERILKVQFR